MKLFLILILCIVPPLMLYSLDDPPVFGPRANLGEVQNNDIDEASGIASSYKNKGILWTHNDSGGENRIFALDTNGVSRGVFYISGSENRDWEDIVVGPGPIDGVSYLYVADIGDNNSDYSTKYIYRFPEPEVLIEQDNSTRIIQGVEKISFKYPDNERDAETLLLDPITKDLYVVGKRDTKVRLYKLPFPHLTNNTIEAELADKLSLPNDPEENTPYNYITSGGISLDGREIILKSYSTIYYWYRAVGVSVAEAMNVQPMNLIYTQEPQGEAICWKNYSDNGYFTLSEENVSAGGITLTFPAQLYYYERSSPVGVKKKYLNFDFKLEQNYPNPFNPSTVITYILPKEGDVNLKVYDILGKEVDELVNEKQELGRYSIEFNAKKLASGVYYYSLKLDNYVQTKKMVVLK